MKRRLAAAIATVLAVALFPHSANAGDRENEIALYCIQQGGGPYVVAACTGGLLTAQEADTCMRAPNQCFGEGNTLRIILTNPGQFFEDVRDDVERSDLNVCNWLGCD